MGHKLLVFSIRCVGLLLLLIVFLGSISGAMLIYSGYIAPELRKHELQSELERQRALLELKKEYGGLIHGDTGS